MSQTARPAPDPTNAHASGKRRLLLGVLLLAGLTVLAYVPALAGGFIWDDDTFLTRSPFIKAADGLRRLWLTTQAPDYWPLTSTTLWVEWRIWGMRAGGYHATNVLMHIGEALLLWTILKRLKIPGAYLAALIFALHPVNVESVAWITQRKNLVAMLFFLLSILCFLQTDPGAPPGPARRSGRGGWYGLSLLAFVLAMLGKGSVAPLPLVLLGIIVWHRRLEASDWMRIAPFLAVAAIFTAVNVGLESHAYGHRMAGFVERMLGAAAALWFYAAKAIWPVNLCFVYPPWSIHIDEFRWWIPLLAAVGTTAGLWIVGKRGRSPWGRGALFAWLYFGAMLVPAMGFTDVGFMEYSLVSDHYQHLALLGVAALAAAGLVSWIGRLPAAARLAGWALCALMTGLLAVLTLLQSRTYADLQTLYTDTLKRNPDCWMAHENLANILATLPGRMPEALAHYETVLRVKPDRADGHYNLANALATVPGRLPESIAQYEEALRLKPDMAEAHENLADVLTPMPGRLPEAIAHYEDALRLKPDRAETHESLANALASLPGRMPEALTQYVEALRLNPDMAEGHYNLANALATLPRRMPETLAQYGEALRLKPDMAEGHENLADALATLPGRMPEALAHYEEALRLNPDRAETHENLANALTILPGRMPEALAQYGEALKLKPDRAETHENLANALATLPGRMPEAIAQYGEALRLKPDMAEGHYNLANALVTLPGRLPEAIAQYEEALRLRPDTAEVHENLANALATLPGRMSEAITHYQEALRLKPDMAEGHENLANALATLPGRLPEAMAHYEEALRIDPDNPEAQNDLAALYARAGRYDEAAAHWELALQLNPALTEARDNLNALRARRK
jgi:tetratricopeptide (TPR) repeat protein